MRWRRANCEYNRRSMRRTLPISARLLDVLPLLAALALRLALWGSLPRTGLISDEGEYLSAAQWLADGRGFDWYQGYLWTRAPLYPLFVAAHLRLFGAGGPWLFVSQTALSLASVALVMALARRLEPHRPWLPRLAGLLAGLYLPLALYAQLVLSETLFIGLLLGALLALTGRPRAPCWASPRSHAAWHWASCRSLRSGCCSPKTTAPQNRRH
jgi:hypothetical protein